VLSRLELNAVKSGVIEFFFSILFSDIANVVGYVGFGISSTSALITTRPSRHWRKLLARVPLLMLAQTYVPLDGAILPLLRDRACSTPRLRCGWDSVDGALHNYE